MFKKDILMETEKIIQNVLREVKDFKGKVLIIGCSTSEVQGKRIGTEGSNDIAKEMLSIFFKYASEFGFELAFQCCEHLNRSIVVERTLKERKGLEEVNAIPLRKAGGAMAEEAYRKFADPCLVEEIEADFGLDIGGTLIGMNLKKVAVPVRLDNDMIGSAKVVFAKTRPKYVGGERAVYNEALK